MQKVFVTYYVPYYVHVYVVRVLLVLSPMLFHFILCPTKVCKLRGALLCHGKNCIEDHTYLSLLVILWD